MVSKTRRGTVKSPSTSKQTLITQFLVKKGSDSKQVNEKKYLSDNDDHDEDYDAMDYDKGDPDDDSDNIKSPSRRSRKVKSDNSNSSTPVKPKGRKRKRRSSPAMRREKQKKDRLRRQRLKSLKAAAASAASPTSPSFKPIKPEPITAEIKSPPRVRKEEKKLSREEDLVDDEILEAFERHSRETRASTKASTTSTLSMIKHEAELALALNSPKPSTTTSAPTTAAPTEPVTPAPIKRKRGRKSRAELAQLKLNPSVSTLSSKKPSLPPTEVPLSPTKPITNRSISPPLPFDFNVENIQWDDDTWKHVQEVAESKLAETILTPLKSGQSSSGKSVKLDQSQSKGKSSKAKASNSSKSKSSKSKSHSHHQPHPHQTREHTAPLRCPAAIVMDNVEIETWYSSLYPHEYARMQKLFICEFCLKYMKSASNFLRHTKKCLVMRPPGDEIYRSKQVIPNFHYNVPVQLSVFEVDGANQKLYCQNLCLLGKLFIDHKTLLYDVEHFLFYVLTFNDYDGSHFVGYFSKEKFSSKRYNVSCIVTLPRFQRCGFGRFLIDFSYLLSRKEGLTGTPEKPLSELGKISYLSYWKYKLFKYLDERIKQLGSGCSLDGAPLSVRELCEHTGINVNDIISTLQWANMIVLENDRWTFILDQAEMERCLGKPRIELFDEKLIWTPLVSWDIPIYEDDNEVYNVLFENDDLREEEDPSKAGGGGKMVGILNAPGSVLKKRKRRRWYKAYPNSQRRRKRNRKESSVEAKQELETSPVSTENSDTPKSDLLSVPETKSLERSDGEDLNEDDLSQFVSQDEEDSAEEGDDDQSESEDSEEEDDDDEDTTLYSLNGSAMKSFDDDDDNDQSSDDDVDPDKVKKAQKKLNFDSSNEDSCDTHSNTNNLEAASKQELSKLRIRIKPVPLPVEASATDSSPAVKRTRSSTRTSTITTSSPISSSTSKRPKFESPERHALLNGDDTPRPKSRTPNGTPSRSTLTNGDAQSEPEEDDDEHSLNGPELSEEDSNSDADNDAQEAEGDVDLILEENDENMTINLGAARKDASSAKCAQSGEDKDQSSSNNSSSQSSPSETNSNGSERLSALNNNHHGHGHHNHHHHHRTLLTNGDLKHAVD